MLSSWGGMLQHLWSLPISMSLTRPNHIIGDTTRSAAFSHHTHTHNTQTHTQHICTTTHTHRHTHNTCIPQFTHTQAQYRDTYTQTHIQHMPIHSSFVTSLHFSLPSIDCSLHLSAHHPFTHLPNHLPFHPFNLPLSPSTLSSTHSFIHHSIYSFIPVSSC